MQEGDNDQEEAETLGKKMARQKTELVIWRIACALMMCLAVLATYTSHRASVLTSDVLTTSRSYMSANEVLVDQLEACKERTTTVLSTSERCVGLAGEAQDLAIKSQDQTRETVDIASEASKSAERCLEAWNDLEKRHGICKALLGNATGQQEEKAVLPKVEKPIKNRSPTG